ncbi:YndM family protein [Oceanobacillus sp. CAU 1775]
MSHLKAIGIKFVFTTIIVLSFLGIFQEMTLQQIITISVVITGVTYVFGDLLILPTFNNVVASIIDLGVAFLSVWLLTSFFIGQSVSVVLISASIAYAFTFCEAVFHIYMKEKVLPKKKGVLIPFPAMRYQTEASKEIHPDKE